MVFTERVAIHPKVMLGKPVIRETRIAVELILRKLAEVSSEADLLDAYPRLTREDVRAAIAYAAEMVAEEETLPSESLEDDHRVVRECSLGMKVST